MVRAIKEIVTVAAGGRIEIRRPELREGTTAEVTIMVAESPRADRRRLADFVGAGKGCFATAAEVDAFIRAERDAWA
ncbi:hypothetical protein RAS1_29480 [Phycisphaerae bacterium RAS1]|nr:hypothetical protein RAS1_29480 [Phycisphaerae bacterium RAS1]